MRTSLARRGFLKAIGFAPAAIPMAGRAMAESALTAGFGVPDVPYASPAGSMISRWSAVGMAKATWAALAKKSEKEEHEWRHAMAFRIGGLEPDIAACRSWSPSFAARAQLRRDMDRAAYLRGARKQLYGWKDDWDD